MIAACDDLGCWVALSQVPRLGAARFRLLETHFDGDLAKAWRAPARELRAAGIGGKVAQAVVAARDSTDPATELEKLANCGVAALTWRDDAYPRLLLETADAPPVLYVRGRLLPEDAQSVGVVGTRRPTDYGRRITGELCRALAVRGVTVVSGLALGIDARAHAATLDAGGRTVAVLGNGLDVVYPGEHRQLAQRIISSGGALVSEFALGVRPEASNFPRRNRIISGMTLGTLVTEAGETSGTRWTVYHALEQNREIFCVPGSVYSEASKLTNRLIREGAKLVTEVSDILTEIGLENRPEQLPLDMADRQAAPAGELRTSHPTQSEQPAVMEYAGSDEPDDPDEAELYRHLTAEPTHIDDLVRLSGQPISQVSGLLTMLELQGLVLPAGAMHYRRAG